MCLPVDKQKLWFLCRALADIFPTSAKECFVAPLAIRVGVLQVIHAKFLYPTAVLDIDYETLDVHTIALVLGSASC